MLNVSGIYVSPFEIEATLVQHQAVLEAAVIGIVNAEGLTKTKAFIVLRPWARSARPNSRPSSRTDWRPTSTHARSSS
jgi:acyl-coenzyme A synthetase/AMP-(fatty) acid ligase